MEADVRSTRDTATQPRSGMQGLLATINQVTTKKLDAIGGLIRKCETEVLALSSRHGPRVFFFTTSSAKG